MNLMTESIRNPNWYMQPLLIGAALALLVGCAAIDPATCTVRVEVPVLVPCRTQEVAPPPWATAGLKRSDSLETKVRALLAERLQRIGYERLLESINSTCSN